MIKKIRRRRVITEIKQVALLTNSAPRSDLRCEFCGESQMISPLLAAKLLKTGTREIYRAIETGTIHFAELPDRQIFVCLQSMNAIFCVTRVTLDEEA
jgi:hypothetical protein